MKNVILKLLGWLLGERLASNTEVTYTLTPRASVLGADQSAGILFARDTSTETISSVQHTVGPNYAPLPDSTLYLSLGASNDSTFNFKSDDIDLIGNVGGRYGDIGTLVGRQTGRFSANMQTFNEWAFEQAFLAPTGAPGVSVVMGTGFIPMTQSIKISGWLQVNYTDQQGVAIVAAICRAQLTYASFSAKEKDYVHPFNCKILMNSLNLIKPETWTAFYGN